MTKPSQLEVLQLLQRLFPAGAEQLYDLRPGAYIGGTLGALASSLTDTLTDRIAALSDEIIPATMRERIPEWEQACGLAYTPVALYGTLEQRRNAVLAALRMSGSFALDDIRAIVQPYFNYPSAANIEIIETPRAAYTAAHTYTNSAPVSVPALTSGRSVVTVADDTRCSPAGAAVFVTLTTTRADRMTFVLTGPGGDVVAFGVNWLSAVPLAVTSQTFTLYAPAMAGKRIRGDWSLGFGNLDTSATVESWGLFVEGLGVVYDTATPPNRLGEGLGAGIFEFAVVADPAQLGPGYDLEGALRAISRWKPAHTIGTVASLSTLTGDICAIPDTDNAIPGRAIPC